MSIPADLLPAVRPHPGWVRSHESSPLILCNAADLLLHTAGVQCHLPGGAILTPPIQVKAGGVVGNCSLDHGTTPLNERKPSPRSSRKDGMSPAMYAVYVCDNALSANSPVSACCVCRGFGTRHSRRRGPRTSGDWCRCSRFRPDTRATARCAYTPPDMGYPTTSRCKSSSLFPFAARLLMASKTNRLGCLRLTERCADILLSIRQEIEEAGNDVGIELDGPIMKLLECVHMPRVHNVLFTL